MCTTVQALLKEVPRSEQELRSAEKVATLPMRMGGLGMRSASRCGALAPRTGLRGRTPFT